MGRICAIIFLLLPCAAAHARPGAWDTPTPSVKAKAAMRRLLKDTRRAARQGKRPLALLDFDDTVNNARPRLVESARRAGLPTHGLRSSAQMLAGLEGAARAEKRAEFGASYFDDTSLVQLDVAQKGARKFVRDFKRAGGRPLVATGRWESTRKATEAQLARERLPIHGRDLLMSPGPQLKAREWKLKVPSLVKRRGTVVFAADNEATSADGYHDAFPGALTARLATFRFDEPPAKKPRGVIVLRNFAP